MNGLFMNGRILIVVLAISLVLGGCMAQAPENTAQQPPPTNPPPANLTPPLPSVADCSTDMSCFIEKSKTCALSKLLSTKAMSLFGVNVVTTSFLQINGSQGNKCSFYIKTMNSSVTYTPAMVEQLQKSGMTPEQIQAQERDSDAQAKATIGSDGTCLFDTPDLTALLTRWSEGKFSSGDYDNASCSGKFFQSH